MSQSASRVLLALFIVNLGVALGAGLYEGRIVLPQWLVTTPDGGVHWSAEAARDANTGIRFWAFVTTGPLTLLTLATRTQVGALEALRGHGGSARRRSRSATGR